MIDFTMLSKTMLYTSSIKGGGEHSNIKGISHNSIMQFIHGHIVLVVEEVVDN